MIFPLSGTIYISPAVASWVLLKKIYEIKIRQCDDIDGCGGVGEGGPRRRGDICVYIYIYTYVIGSVVQKKLIQHCIVIILQ